MLCDTIAVDDYMKEKERQLKQMTDIMDMRAKARELLKQKEAVKKMEEETRHCREENSQIIFAERRRFFNDEELAALVGSRKFVSLE